MYNKVEYTGGIGMNKEELGKKIAKRVKNKDIELAQKTISDITTYISNFYSNDIALEGHYDEVQAGYSGYECMLKVFNVTLNYSLEDFKITVTKTEDETVSKIDEINIDNGKVYCNHGEFSVKEIEQHLIECFKDLIQER